MEGMLRVIKVPAYHVPGCKVRLLSTSSLLQTYTREQIILDDIKLTLSGESIDPTRGAVIAMINPSNNLPTSQFYSQSDINVPVQVLQTNLTTVNAENYNLSEPQKEFFALALPSRSLGFQKDSVTNEIRHAEPHSRHLQSTYCSLKDHNTTTLFCLSVQKTDETTISQKGVKCGEGS
jgi:hypothetical protein